MHQYVELWNALTFSDKDGAPQAVQTVFGKEDVTEDIIGFCQWVYANTSADGVREFLTGMVYRHIPISTKNGMRNLAHVVASLPSSAAVVEHCGESEVRISTRAVEAFLRAFAGTDVWFYNHTSSLSSTFYRTIAAATATPRRIVVRMAPAHYTARHTTEWIQFAYFLWRFLKARGRIVMNSRTQRRFDNLQRTVQRLYNRYLHALREEGDATHLPMTEVFDTIHAH